MKEETFQFDRASIKIAARTIEFWRGEYAKRRVLTDPRNNYEDIQESIETLKNVAETVYINTGEEQRLESSRDYELIILNLIAEGMINKKERPGSGKYDFEKLQRAYEFSVQYGYVISDLSITTSPWSSKNNLLILVEKLDKKYWENGLVEELRASDEVRERDLKKYGPIQAHMDPNNWHTVIEEELWIPRFFGPNASPWHRTHLLSEGSLPTIGRHDIKPDVAFAVKGIGDDEFQIRSTVGKIETDLCKLRIYELHKKQEALLIQLRDLALESEEMIFEERQLFKELDPATLETFLDTKINQILLDKDDFKMLSMQFSSEIKKEVRAARGLYVKITKEMLKLFKRLSIASREMLSGPYRGQKAELSRAKGLYLWDTVHIEGKTDNEALEELKSLVANHCEGLLVEDSPKNNKQIMRLRITEDCIRDNRFLPMS